MSPLLSVRENQESARSCSARLQAGTLESRTCPPEGGRYTNQNQVLTHTLLGLVVYASTFSRRFRSGLRYLVPQELPWKRNLCDTRRRRISRPRAIPAIIGMRFFSSKETTCHFPFDGATNWTAGAAKLLRCFTPSQSPCARAFARPAGHWWAQRPTNAISAEQA